MHGDAMADLSTFQGKLALVTGAGDGIGEMLTARALEARTAAIKAGIVQI